MINLGKTLCLRWSEHPADELVRTCDNTLKLTKNVCRGLASADRRIKALGDDQRAVELGKVTERVFKDVLKLREEIEKIREELKEKLKHHRPVHVKTK